MVDIVIRTVNIDDEQAFLYAVNQSKDLHSPWTNVPDTSAHFKEYVKKYSRFHQNSPTSN